MKRVLWFVLTGALLGSLSLQVQPHAPGSQLKSDELWQYRGGDARRVTYNERCDMLGPLPYLVGCTGVNAPCKICVQPNLGIAWGTGLQVGYSPPGKKFLGNVPCGEKFDGICSWNGSIWVCVGSLQGFDCNVDAIVPQRPGDPGYEDPLNP